MNRKIRGTLIGAIIGAALSAGLVGICGLNMTITIGGAIIGAIVGGVIGLIFVVGAMQREKEVETGLGS